MKYGRAMTLDMVEGDEPWTTAEIALLEGCDTGEMVVLDGPDRPESGTDTNTIRAELIRHLMLGGCEEVAPHVKGVQVQGTYVTGELDLEECKTSLTLVVLDTTFELPVNLRDTDIGQVCLNGSKMDGLDGRRMRVDRNVMLGNGFQSTGSVRLAEAVIGGQLDCSSGRFESETDGYGSVLSALDLRGIRVARDVFLFGGFEANGTTNLLGAEIGGQLVCSDARFSGRMDEAGNPRPALIGQQLKVSGNVFLRDGFCANGLVTLLGAEINGQLDCSKGQFDGGADIQGSSQPALMGHALTVREGVLLGHGFRANGLVDLTGSKIGMALNCEGGNFINGGLNLQGVKIAGDFIWRGIFREVALLDLSNVQVAALWDDAPSWRSVEKYKLRGFQYKTMDDHMSVTNRIRWLVDADGRKLPNWKIRSWFPANGAAKDIDPQPFTHLARFYDRTGNRKWAEKVRIALERRLRRSTYNSARYRMALSGSIWRSFWLMISGEAKRAWGAVYGAVFGYGFAPLRALAWSTAIVLLAALFFDVTYSKGQMAPNSDVILTSEDWSEALWYGCTDVQEDDCKMPLRIWEDKGSYQDYETFSALGYGFDLFIPLDALGQEKAWAPSYSRGPWGAFGYWLRWFIQVAGWLITFVSAAMLTGLVGKRD